MGHIDTRILPTVVLAIPLLLDISTESQDRCVHVVFWGHSFRLPPAHQGLWELEQQLAFVS